MRLPDPANEVIEPRKRLTVARVGDCFLLRDHRLLVRDAREPKNFDRLLSLVKGADVDQVTPYNVKELMYGRRSGFLGRPRQIGYPNGA